MQRHPKRPAPVGAYGLRLEGLETAEQLLVPAPANWPPVTVSWHVGSFPSRPQTIGEDRADLPFPSGTGRVEIDRHTTQVRLTLDKASPDADIVHPFFCTAASVWAWWLGREAFHAGGFVVDGGAWGVMGGKGSGKSSTLAYLAKKGVGIVSDDLMVLTDGRAMAGPRCIDLRGDAATRLEIGKNLGVVGVRERWRVPVEPVAAEMPFRGWVSLEWGDEVEIRRLRPSAWLGQVSRHRALNVAPRDPVAYLTLAALPSFQLTRPHSLRSLDKAIDQLLEAIGSCHLSSV
jgi:hypothetical protein